MLHRLAGDDGHCTAISERHCTNYSGTDRGKLFDILHFGDSEIITNVNFSRFSFYPTRQKSLSDRMPLVSASISSFLKGDIS